MSDIDATPANWRELIRFDDAGLIPAIVQETHTREVLMLAWMDLEALERTLSSGRAVYWSRSRQEHWVKGETSGHIQVVVSVSLDCDADAILLEVEQTGPACHTLTPTCFTGRTISSGRTTSTGGDQPRTEDEQ